MKRLSCIFLFLCACLYAQPPGGVKGYSLWVHPDKAAPVSATEELSGPQFNYNPVLDFSLLPSFYKGVLSSNFSFFVVFRSASEGEQEVLGLRLGSGKGYISNKSMLWESDMKFKKINSQKGILLSFISGSGAKGKKNNFISVAEAFLGHAKDDDAIAEIIIYPRLLTVKEREKVETYLSIKYGLSLIGGYNYTDASGRVLWNVEDNRSYNYRVTGIGRDDAMCLNQKQSANSEGDGISIGFGTVEKSNGANKQEIGNGTFMLWGDNGKSTSFNNSKSITPGTMDRMWKIYSYDHEHHTCQLRIDKKAIGFPSLNQGFYYWLAIDGQGDSNFDYAAAKYIKPASEDSCYLYYNDIIWDADNNGSDVFTIVTGSSFFITASAVVSCEAASGAVSATMAGGSPPYTVVLKSNNGSVQEKKVFTSEATFEALPSGDYTISVMDSNNVLAESSASTDSFKGAVVSLQQNWYIDEKGSVTISPQVTDVNSQVLEYIWSKDEKTLSSDNKITLSEEGNYVLEVSTNSGDCKKIYPFTVSKSSEIFKVYPNPVQKFAKFNADIHFSAKKDCTLQVSSSEGKIVYTEHLGFIKDYSYQNSLVSSGVYFITLFSGDEIHTQKLIVKD